MTTASLPEVVDRYFAARAVLHPLLDDATPEKSPEWGVFEAAERDLIAFPCSSMAELRTKASVVLGDPAGLLDELERNPEALRAFLKAIRDAKTSDPVLDLCRRWQALWDGCVTVDEDPEGNERWSEEINDIEREIAETKPASAEGAVAMLEVLSRTGGASRHNDEILANVTVFLRMLDRGA